LRRAVEYSLPGFIGAFVGVVIGVINYGVVIAFVEARLRKLDRSQTQEERDEFERKISLMRRIVLTIDIVAFSAVGYWFGRTVGG
jgi:pheromone shutdown protein TraB